MEPLRLPWEVIERVIDQSDGDAATLRSLSLTCRQLLPRSRRMLFTRVKFETKEQVFEFVDFLQDRSHMTPLVRSIAVEPTDFPPFPLLHLLSNLSEIRFTRPKKYLVSEYAIPALHHSALTCLQRFVTSNMHTLRISKIRFSTHLPFARLLLAFPSITHLYCEEVAFEREGDLGPLEVIRQRLSRQMRLKSLTIDNGFFEFDNDHGASILTFLSSTESAPFQVEKLTVVVTPKQSSEAPSPFFGWSSLQTLVVCVPKVLYGMVNATRFLQNLHLQDLLPRDVLVELGPLWSPQSLTLDSVISECESMERALLHFSQPRVLLTIDKPLYPNMLEFWTRRMAKNFPVLSQRGALTVKSDIVSGAGHGDTIRALAVSPDCKWVASASDDTTIVLWNTNDGSVAHQWVAYAKSEAVCSLAFSPDSSKLLSGGEDGTVAVWNLEPESGALALPNIVKLIEPELTYFKPRRVSSCAWLPGGPGTAIAILTTGSWSTLTLRGGLDTDFRWLSHLYTTAKHATNVAFSPDGRWLVSRTARCRYKIWDVAALKLHKEIQHEEGGSDGYECLELQVPPVFDPGSKRIATVSGRAGGRFDVWDVETGDGVFGFEDEHMINAVSFSPDGTILLTGLDNGTVRLWDAQIGTQLSVLKGSLRWLSAALFSPCGKYIAAVSYGGVVVVWRVGDQSCVGTFEPSEDAVPDYAGIAFAPDGKKLVMFGSNTDCRVIIRVISDVFV